MRVPHVWLVTLPLAFAGCELGHSLVNALVGSPTGSRGEFLDGAGPGAELVPGLAAAVAAIVLLALVVRVAGGSRTPQARPSAVPFALLAPTMFALQEHLESLAGGLHPLGTVLEPTFLPGLAIQAPFALAAFLLARLLLGAADRARLILTRRPRLLVVVWGIAIPSRLGDVTLPGGRRAGGDRGRAPPLALVVSG